MYRKDTLKRYQLFLNEWLEYVQTDLPITATELCYKYGVSTNFPTFVVQQGWFKREGGAGKHGKWLTTKPMPFTVVETQTLIDAFNAHKYKKKNIVVQDRVLPTKGEAEKWLAPRKNGSLTETSTQDLINELKRRGYKGHITSEINF